MKKTKEALIKSGAQIAPQGTTEISAPAAKKNARVTIDGTKFMVDGKELWINGVNTP